jgi:molybdopterin-guanine dinucleotide biosynthesis protein A
LVGDLAVYDALTAELECAPFQGRVADAPGGVGPLGGLRAVLATAAEHGQSHVTVIACDMPYVTSALLAELREHSSTAPVLAARRDAEAPWEPMLARYRPAAVLPVLDATLAAGARSFQALFKQLEVARFEADGVLAALADWDTPRDVRA